jgi:hypothetical protein
VQLLKHFFSKPGGCDAIAFDLVPVPSPLVAIMPRKAKVSGYDNQSSSLDLAQFADAEAFFESQGDKRRRKRPQAPQPAGEAGRRAEFRVVWPGSDEFAGLVHACVEMKRRWLAETGRISRGFAIEGYDRFLASLSGDEQGREGAVAFVLEAAGRPVAIEVSMIRNRHLYAYVGGFDWELNKFSPGKVQMEATVCWCIENGIGHMIFSAMPLPTRTTGATSRANCWPSTALIRCVAGCMAARGSTTSGRSSKPCLKTCRPACASSRPHQGCRNARCPGIVQGAAWPLAHA